MSSSFSFSARRLLIAAVSAAAIGCVSSPPPRPNVILISVDTLRPDRLGCYGATQVRTPAIDSLCKAGTKFDNAFTPVPLTLPAHWTIHTGIEPWRHGAIDNGITLASPPGPTLAQRFADAGYDTAAFVAAFVLHRTFGLDRGFARYDDGPAGDAALDQPLHATGPAAERVDRAIQWLRRERTKPYFLWLHLFDPHAPYAPPGEFQAAYAGRLYDGEVAYVDSQLARLMDAVERSGAAGRTVVVLLSDHGESLGEHGERTHGVLLYDATLRVPLVLRLPGRVPAGLSRPDPVTLADVAPTILSLSGLAATPGVDGRDLFGADQSARPIAAVSEAPRLRLGWAGLIALREGSWKYIAGPRPELYNTANDPAEMANRMAQEGARAEGLSRGADVLESTLRATLAARRASDPNAGERARLSALGYVSAGSAPTKEAPNPRDVIATMNELDLAYQLFAEGRLGEAERSFRGLLESARGPAAPVLEGLARLALARGKPAEAELLYARLLSRDPDSVAALAQLVGLARSRGDHRAALERSRRLVALAPNDGGASRLLAETLAASGDLEAAEVEWRRGLRVAPRAGWLRLGFARFLVQRSRGADARKELKLLLKDEDQPESVLEAARKLMAEI